MDFLNSPLWHVPAWSGDVIGARPLEEWHRRALSTRWLLFFFIPLGYDVFARHRHGLYLLSKRRCLVPPQPLPSSSHEAKLWPKGNGKVRRILSIRMMLNILFQFLIEGAFLFTLNTCPAMWAREREEEIWKGGGGGINVQGNHSHAGLTVGGMAP